MPKAPGLGAPNAVTSNQLFTDRLSEGRFGLRRMFGRSDAVGTLLLLAGKPAEEAANLVEIGAAFSVLVLMAQSSRVREIAGSIWVQYYLMAFAWVQAR